MIWNIIPVLLFTGILFLGCEKENKIDYITSEQEIPLTIICGEQQEVADWSSFKSALSVNEKEISDLNIYLLDDSGNIIQSWFSLYNKIFTAIISSSRQYSIYAIANLGYEKKFNSYDDLKRYSVQITDINGLVNAKGGLLMCGYIDFKKYMVPATAIVPLIRCVAQFVVKCDFSGLRSNVNVKVTRVQLKNAPRFATLFYTNTNGDFSVIDGEIIDGANLSDINSQGISFYLFENMQGIVAPDAIDNKSKILGMSAYKKSLCSYIEMEYDYLSNRKFGTILYRFYLGKTYKDCDVKRNTKYVCTVYFRGEASVEENSESVDISNIKDRVTSIKIVPSSLRLLDEDDSKSLMAEVLPHSAYNKVISWTSTNDAVAVVDSYGRVTSTGLGNCKITAASTDGTNISSECDVNVVKTELAVRYANYYHMINNDLFVEWSLISPIDAIPTVITSDPNAIQVIEVTATGVKLRKNTGSVVIVTAFLGKSKVSFNVY